MEFKTKQEQFWAGVFGDEYIERNRRETTIASNIMFFSKVLKRAEAIQSAIEFGANIGFNLLALKQLNPSINLTGVDLNQKAFCALDQIVGVKAYHASIVDFILPQKYDLAFVKGVLIHISPDMLSDVYDQLYNASKKYILIAEYYNPVPVEVEYRGHKGKLFKRDFAGEIMERYNDLSLVDYGFVYHRDFFPQDDLTWFLLKK